MALWGMAFQVGKLARATSSHHTLLTLRGSSRWGWHPQPLPGQQEGTEKELSSGKGPGYLLSRWATWVEAAKEPAGGSHKGSLCLLWRLLPYSDIKGLELGMHSKKGAPKGATTHKGCGPQTHRSSNLSENAGPTRLPMR